MELKKIFEIIWARKWVIIQAFIVITLTAFIGSYLIKPTYMAIAKASVSSSNASSSIASSLGMEDIAPSLSNFSVDSMENVIAQVTLLPYMENMIGKLQLRNEENELMLPQNLISTGILYQIRSSIFPVRHIEVLPYKETNMFQINATSRDPEEAMMMANTLAGVFISELQKLTRQEANSARIFIEDQITKIRGEWLSSLEGLKEFQKTNKTVNLDEEISIAIAKMAELMKQKEDNIIDLAEEDARLKALKGQVNIKGDLGITPEALIDNPQIKILMDRLAGLKIELAGALATATEEHPKVIGLRMQIDRTQKELKKEMATHRELSPQIEESSRKIAALKAHLSLVNGNIEKYSSFFMSIPDKSTEMTRFKQSMGASEKIYNALLDYNYKIGIIEATTLSNIRLLEPAGVPLFPFKPNIFLNTILGAFLGLMSGVGLAFFSEYMDDTIKSPGDIEAYDNTPLLGTIYNYGKACPPLISGMEIRSPAYEAFRTTRNSIRFASIDKPVKSLLITSAIAGEGKTNIVANLGISLAREDKKVLLIDTDLRRPRLETLMGIKNQSGLTNVLVGDITIEDAICHTSIDMVDLLPSGTTSLDPGRVIESQKLMSLIASLSQEYDYVLLDSPPILSFDDAVIMAGYVDGTILVVESKKITPQAIIRIKAIFERARLKPLGVILNKFVDRHYSGSYYYGDYYNYYYQDRKSKWGLWSGKLLGAIGNKKGHS